MCQAGEEGYANGNVNSSQLPAWMTILYSCLAHTWRGQRICCEAEHRCSAYTIIIHRAAIKHAVPQAFILTSFRLHDSVSSVVFGTNIETIYLYSIVLHIYECMQYCGSNVDIRVTVTCCAFEPNWTWAWCTHKHILYKHKWRMRVYNESLRSRHLVRSCFIMGMFQFWPKLKQNASAVCYVRQKERKRKDLPSGCFMVSASGKNGWCEGLPCCNLNAV